MLDDALQPDNYIYYYLATVCALASVLYVLSGSMMDSKCNTSDCAWNVVLLVESAGAARELYDETLMQHSELSMIVSGGGD